MKILNYFAKHPRMDALLVAAALAIFGTITLVHAPNPSIWFDEAFTAYLTRFNYWEIAQLTAADVHPPLYYWTVKTWTLLFGNSELAFRSLSVLFGGVAIVGAHLTARRFFGRSVAAASLLFLTLSPMLIRYSDEARMYTMAAAIVVAATLVLSRAVTTKGKKWWVIYGILVSLGMWTHYFTALAWIAHWVWRGFVTPRKDLTLKQWRAVAFGGRWLFAYIVAVGLYLPWLPLFVYQTGLVQAGFWIAPITADTATNYFANYFYYFEHEQVIGWYFVCLVAVLVVTATLTPSVYKKLRAPEKKHYLLVASLAWVSPLILMIVSLPPLRSVFVERYLIPATVFAGIYFAATLVIGTRSWRLRYRLAPFVLTAGMMIVGIVNVYNLGNFNKNSNTAIMTRDVIQKIQQTAPKGTPIVAQTPWVFYEAVFYDSTDYPVYFINEATNYIYGSLEMLRVSDNHKITDLGKFKQEHPVIWYIGNDTSKVIPPFEPSWQEGPTISVPDPQMGDIKYKATEYRFQGL